MGFLKKLLLCSSFIALLPLSEKKAFAADDDAELALLKQQVADITKKIEALSKKRKGKKPGGVPKSGIATSTAKLQEAKLEQPDSKGLPQPVVTPGNDKMSLQLSGQVNRIAAWRTNGHKQRIEHLDNNASSSRFKLTGEGKVNEDFKVQGVIEYELTDGNPSSSAQISQASEGGNFANAARSRRIEAIFISKSLGSIFLGQGSMAADNSSEVDYSGTFGGSNGSETPFNLGGVQFYSKTTKDEIARTASAAFNNFDGLSRANRIRYDTPQFYGFVLGASHSNRDQVDAALNFAATLYGTKIGFAAGYSYPPFFQSSGNGRKHRQYNGSFSILFPCGISLGGAGGVRKFDIEEDANGVRRRNAYFWFSKLGYQWTYFNFGKTAVAVDVGRAHRHAFAEANFATVNSERLLSYAFFAVQNIDKAATEIYFTLRAYDFKRREESFKKAYVAALGARVKF
jgi:hypothetical protein